MTATALVVFARRLGLDRLADIAWPWYVLIGTTVTVAVGVAAAHLSRDGAGRLDG
jgi:hypothetical protein